jgi:hypothetical protein
MRYTPAWEGLAEAAKRIMEATGTSQSDAQAGLCRAIAEGAVGIQAHLGKQSNGITTMSNTIIEGRDISIPTSLKPEELDWSKSRPLKAWLVRRGGRAPHGFWHLEWIKVSVADVTKVFGQATTEDSAPAPKTSRKSAKARRTRPAYDDALRAIQATCPNGVPGQTELPNPILYKRVETWLKRNRLGLVSRDTILRVAGRRK